jgi:hypothetical protein
MTKKLEELFNLDSTEQNEPIEEGKLSLEETKIELAKVDDAIDKIEHALPLVKGLDTGDAELDAIAAKAMESFENLMDLGFNVDSRFSSEIFNAASGMMGHALTAKNAKLTKKLKMVDLQLKKLKLDYDISKNAPDNTVVGSEEPGETATGYLISRNELLDRLVGPRDQNSKDA